MNLVDINLLAVLPEIVLTLAICGIITIDLFLPDWLRWAIMPLAFGGVLLTLASLAFLPDLPVTTFGGMFVVDNFAVLFKALFCLAALFCFVISTDYLKEHEAPRGEYYSMLLCSLLGMLTIASSRDLISIFVSLELISLPAIVLSGIRKEDLKSNEAALKFFLFSVLSTALMLFGMSILYGITGSTNLAGIASGLSGRSDLLEVGVLSTFFVIVGFGFKISVFPFQWWVPDTYEGSPVPIAAFLSVASKTAGFVGLFQVMFLGLIPLAHSWRPLFAIIGVVTMTFGNLVAIQQKNVVRLLAYSSIAQAGYMVLPLGVASATNFDLNSQILFASVGYLLVYGFMEYGAFSAAIAVGRREGSYELADYGGLFQRSPVLAVTMAAFMMSLAGIPPLGGWWAKFVVFKALISGGATWLAVAMAVNTVIALFYYAIVVKRMFVDQSASTEQIKAPFTLRGAIGLTALAVLVLGIAPDTVGHFAANLNFF